MVKPRERKTNRGQIPQDLYEVAAHSVINENMTVRAVARQYGMCHVSLNRFVNAVRENRNPVVGYRPHNKVFSIEQEQQLGQYVESAAKLYFGLSPRELRKLGFQFARLNNCNYPQNWNNLEMASEDWLTAFLKRNPTISIRTPESTSLARAMNFNKENVKKFYSNLATVLDKWHFEPQNIYNVDETGCTTVHKPNKVLATKGVKQVGQITSQERGTLVTMCLAVSALGNSVPPMFIFPLKRYQDHFVLGGPAGSIGTANQSGWMKEEDFLIFIMHFAKFAKPSENNRVLLILDNHQSHLYIPVIDYCRSNYITLLSFPPHTSHKLQPLDRSVFGPFKRYYNSAGEHWMRSNPGRRMTIYNIPGLVKDALPMAITPKNITAGFSCSGIWPFNPDVFTEEDFAPSSVTDRPQTPNFSDNTEADPNASKISLPEFEPAASSTEVDIGQPSTSTQKISTPPAIQKKTVWTPEEIRPLPKADFSAPRKAARRKGKTAILTDTPEKEILEARYLAKKNVGGAKKKVFTKEKKKGATTKNIRVVKTVEQVSSSEEEDDTICLVCCGPYKNSKVDWLQCTSCKQWAHSSCAKNDPLYVCKNCVSEYSENSE